AGQASHVPGLCPFASPLRVPTKWVVGFFSCRRGVQPAVRVAGIAHTCERKLEPGMLLPRSISLATSFNLVCLLSHVPGRPASPGHALPRSISLAYSFNLACWLSPAPGAARFNLACSSHPLSLADSFNLCSPARRRVLPVCIPATGNSIGLGKGPVGKVKAGPAFFGACVSAAIHCVGTRLVPRPSTFFPSPRPRCCPHPFPILSVKARDAPRRPVGSDS